MSQRGPSPGSGADLPSAGTHIRVSSSEVAGVNLASFTNQDFSQVKDSDALVVANDVNEDGNVMTSPERVNLEFDRREQQLFDFPNTNSFNTNDAEFRETGATYN